MMSDNGNVRPKVDYERRVYITRDGIELHIRKVPVLILERLLNDSTGRPEVPTVEVKIGGKHTRHEPNPNDSQYQEALLAWTQDQRIKMLRYVLTVGIEEDPPKDFIEFHREFFPTAGAAQMKYLWISSLMGEPADIEDLSEALMGQTAVTEKGVEEATQSFPSPGEPDGPPGIPVGETPS